MPRGELHDIQAAMARIGTPTQEASQIAMGDRQLRAGGGRRWSGWRRAMRPACPPIGSANRYRRNRTREPFNRVEPDAPGGWGCSARHRLGQLSAFGLWRGAQGDLARRGGVAGGRAAQRRFTVGAGADNGAVVRAVGAVCSLHAWSGVGERWFPPDDKRGAYRLIEENPAAGWPRLLVFAPDEAQSGRACAA